MSNGRKSEGTFGRLLRNVRSVFAGSTGIDRTPAAERAATTAAAAAPAQSASELINEGLQERQRVGAAAARPFFERAAQLEPNSHVPWFMLGNVASELGDLDSAVAHYAHARPAIARLWPELEMTEETMDRIADHIANFSLAYLKARPKTRSNAS